MTDERATLSVRVKLLNPTREKQTVSASVDGCTFENQGIDEVTIPVEISNPHRWHGMEDPYLYPIEIRVGEDLITKHIGLRTIEVDANSGLKLNGKPYEVRGVCRHQEWETKLNALSFAEHVRDLEYGAGASILHHEESIRKTNPGAMWHPEAWQTEYHILNWIELSKRDYLWGTFIWNLFDFSASHRTEGDREGINDKGLVTHDRQTYKDAFYFYKANWRTDTPVLHVCEKRFTHRKSDKVFVRAFSNVGPVELLVNGESKGCATPNDLSIVTWNDIPLQPGDNTIELRAKNGTLTDGCTWTRLP